MRDTFDWPGFLPDFSSAASRQGFRSETLLETSQGPLVAWEKAGPGPVVYLSAGIHGDEPAGPLALLEMMESGSFPDPFHWLLCPALNPSGLALGTRETDVGADLNRDYWKRRSPETKAHIRWLASKPLPDLFVSLHEDWETEGFYFYEINLGEDRPLRAEALLAAVARVFPPEGGPEIDGHLPRHPGWIYHANEADLPGSWPEAIYLAKQGCPLSFTFETPSRHPLAERVAAHIAATRAVLACYE